MSNIITYIAEAGGNRLSIGEMIPDATSIVIEGYGSDADHFSWVGIVLDRRQVGALARALTSTYMRMAGDE